MEKVEKTICLCAIVKNEEKIFPRLINSCKHLLDYWIVIDTGSTDNTIAIVKEQLEGIPGEIHESPFINFGHNRTELVQKAKGKADYLLLMDADMMIVADKRFNKSDLAADMYQIRYEGNIDFSQPLFVSGHIDWFYEGYTHEYLTTKGSFKVETHPFLRVSHGYDGGSRGDKYNRDIKLCTQEIADHPGRSRPHFYLGQTHQNMGNYDEAIKSYQKRIQMGGWAEEIYYSLYQVGICLYLSKDIDSAILQFTEAYNTRPIRFEALFMMGQLFREKKKYSVAKIFFEKVLKMPYPKNDILFIHRTQYDYLADFELGICNYWLGQYKDAEKHASRLLNRKGIDPNVEKQNLQNYKFIKGKLALQKANKNDIVYVSMYTHGTPYEQEVKVLDASLRKHNLFFEIVGIRPQGSWIKNTQMKPQVILQEMDKHNKDVVWLDADAEVMEKPVFFDTIKTDLAFHALTWRKGTPDEFHEILVGTLYFRNNDKVRDFLRKWISINEQVDKPDGETFQMLMNDAKGIGVTELPAEYVRIFDSEHMKGVKPIIMHNQASRRFKEIVNTGLDPDNLIFSFINDRINGEDSCSVIGNGPFSSDLSREIDNSFVMRCNNFKKGEDYEPIGDRVDLNISSLYHEIIPSTRVDYPIFGVLPISETLYQKYTEAKQMHNAWAHNYDKLISLGNTVWTYNEKDDYSKLFSEVAAHINAFPTVGILGIATARKLGFKRIILTGFTFFQSEKSHYWSDIKINPSNHHDPVAEKNLIRHWIDNDDIEYVLDEKLKENLYQDETVRHDTAE